VSETLDAIPVVAEDDVPHHGRERVARLRAGVGGLRTRAASRGLDFYLFLAGAVLVPFGFLVILLGWYGASKTGYVFDQIPYMISGGLMGLGLVLVGSFAYFAYWLTRMFHQQREQTDRTVAVLERLEARLADLPAGNGAGAGSSPARASSGSGRRNGGAPFVATASGTMFHLPDCSVVVNRPKIRKVRGDEPGMEPCRLCDPLGATQEA
jgi:hypothetical protein